MAPNRRPRAAAGTPGAGGARKAVGRRSSATPAHPPTPLALPLLTALAGGLAASSCCALQLALNALGFACAGFAVLDPHRPAAIAATAVALAALHRRHGSWRVTGLAAVAAAGLTALPDLLAAVGRAGGVGAALRAAVAGAAGSAAAAAPTASTTTLLRVAGMKCAACGERARAAVASLPGVAGAAVDWQAGTVRVEGRGEGVRAAVEAALGDRGFEVVEN